jgi:tRNA 2-thiouridine synthesizing protein A
MTTPERIFIDARGMRCPRPVVELAKARRRASPGSQLEIVADDPAFESDVRAWCEATGCHLQELKATPEGIRVLVRVPEEKAA